MLSILNYVHADLVLQKRNQRVFLHLEKMIEEAISNCLNYNCITEERDRKN